MGRLDKEVVKAQVNILRKFLIEHNIELSQSNGYQAIAKMNGFKDWNHLSAAFKKEA